MKKKKYVAFNLELNLYNSLKNEADNELSTVTRILRLILTERYKDTKIENNKGFK
jgi:hypothetical protein